MATVQVFTRRLYGKPRIYPANELASTLVQLTQRPTFTAEDIAVIQQLGYTVEQVTDPREPLGTVIVGTGSSAAGPA